MWTLARWRGRVPQDGDTAGGENHERHSPRGERLGWSGFPRRWQTGVSGAGVGRKVCREQLC